MAESLRIETKQNAAKLIVDGNEIRDVLEYRLEESAQKRVLTVSVAIKDSVEVLAR